MIDEDPDPFATFVADLDHKWIGQRVDEQTNELAICGTGKLVWKVREISATGKKTWATFADVKTLTLKQARHAALNYKVSGGIKAERQRNKDMADAAAADRVTFKQLYDEWFAYGLPKLRESTQRTYKSIAKHHLLPMPIMQKRARDITHQHFFALQDKMADSPDTANIVLAIIGAVYRHAIQRTDLLPNFVSPTTSHKPLPTNPDQPCHTEEEVWKLYCATKPLMSDRPAANGLFICSKFGCRVSEIGGITMDEIDPHSMMWEIGKRYKTHKRHPYPLNAETLAAVTAMAEWRPNIDKTRAITRLYYELVAEAGIRALGLHALRRAVITWIFENVGLEAAQRYAGHKTPAQTLVYVKAGQSYQRKIAAEIDAKRWSTFATTE